MVPQDDQPGHRLPRRRPTDSDDTEVFVVDTRRGRRPQGGAPEAGPDDTAQAIPQRPAPGQGGPGRPGGEPTRAVPGQGRPQGRGQGRLTQGRPAQGAQPTRTVPGQGRPAQGAQGVQSTRAVPSQGRPPQGAQPTRAVPNRAPGAPAAGAAGAAGAAAAGSAAASGGGRRTPAYVQGQGRRPVDDGTFDEGYGPDRTREIPAAAPRGSGAPPRGRRGGQAPPPRPPQGPPTPREGRPPRAARPRRRWRRWLAALLVVVMLWVGALVWAASSAWNTVTKIDAIPTDNRPAEGKGTNIVLVGSDSREGLTAEQRDTLGTGRAEGRRTDSIMLLHIPDSGNPTLVSLPRDSYVEIPGRGRNKINASYSIGGPKLLNQTVEAATGLRVDGYMEIGFGGFASVVDSVGGVEMCLDKPMKDVKAAIDLPAGCQTLDGKNALGYVRARYSDPLGDLGRAQRQREFLGALMNKMATPANLLNPVKLRSMGTSGAQGVAVDNDMSPYGALKIMLALRKISNGSGQSVQVPVADSNYQTRSGDAVLWDAARSQALFGALNNDESPNVAP